MPVSATPRRLPLVGCLTVPMLRVTLSVKPAPEWQATQRCVNTLAPATPAEVRLPSALRSGLRSNWFSEAR